jgi:hypothetical protein
MMKTKYRLKLGAKAKAVRAKIQKSSGGDQFKNLKEWVSFYAEHQRLPSTKILCSSCKKKATSMFGDNLKRTLPKFGSVEGLLTKFECSSCRKAKAPVKEPKAKAAKGKKNRLEVDSSSKESSSEYLTVDQMEDRKEKVRATLPKVNPDYKAQPINLESASEVAELTQGACQRPDIYLDAGCVHCPLYKHCVCASKNDKDLLKGDRQRKRK